MMIVMMMIVGLTLPENGQGVCLYVCVSGREMLQCFFLYTFNLNMEQGVRRRRKSSSSSKRRRRWYVQWRRAGIPGVPPSPNLTARKIY